MAYLSDAASADLAWVVRNITESNGLEKPTFDDKSIETLARNYAELGYARQIQLLEDFGDRPFWTLLNILLKLDTVDPAFDEAERAQVQIAADSCAQNQNPGEATYQALLNFARASATGSPEKLFLEYLKDRPLVTLLLFIVFIHASSAAQADITRLGILSDAIQVI